MTTGVIVTTPPSVELPPGSTSGGTSTLPPVTYTYALLNLSQAWTAKQTFGTGLLAADSPVFTGTLTAQIVSGLSVLPIVDGSSTLGSTSQRWSAAYLKSGGVIDFGAGDFTITHSAGALAFSGALNVGGVIGAPFVTITNNSANAFSLIGNTNTSIGFNLTNTIGSGRNWGFYSSGGGPSPLGSFVIYDNTGGGARFIIGTDGAVTLNSTTASTSTTTGSFITPGGAGIAGALNVGGTVSAPTFLAANDSTGAGVKGYYLKGTGGSLDGGFFQGPANQVLFKMGSANIFGVAVNNLSSFVGDYGSTNANSWTFAAPVIGTSTVTATGYKVSTNQVVGARVTGYTAMTGTPDKATAFATSTVTLAQLAGRVMQLQADLTTHGLIGA